MAYFSQVSLTRRKTIKKQDGGYETFEESATVQFQPYEVPMAIPEMSISFDEASRRIALMLDSSMGELTESDKTTFKTFGGR